MGKSNFFNKVLAGEWMRYADTSKSYEQNLERINTARIKSRLGTVSGGDAIQKLRYHLDGLKGEQVS
jgi:hypothetical protein